MNRRDEFEQALQRAYRAAANADSDELDFWRDAAEIAAELLGVPLGIADEPPKAPAVVCGPGTCIC